MYVAWLHQTVEQVVPQVV